MSDYATYKKGLVSHPVAHEDVEQKIFIEWLEWQKIKFTAIPNSTYTKSWKQKVKNKTMGLRPGLPDLLLIVDNRLVFIEMKREKGGTVSEYQKEWIEAINRCENAVAVVCRGGDAAIKAVEEIKKDFYFFKMKNK